jgi:hypothetical protein
MDTEEEKYDVQLLGGDIEEQRDNWAPGTPNTTPPRRDSSTASPKAARISLVSAVTKLLNSSDNRSNNPDPSKLEPISQWPVEPEKLQQLKEVELVEPSSPGGEPQKEETPSRSPKPLVSESSDLDSAPTHDGTFTKGLVT